MKIEENQDKGDFTMATHTVRLTGGILNECFQKVRQNFYERIDENKHAAVYAGVFEESYAEPEFTGKFLDICAYYYESEKDERALRKGMAVVNSIRENQREDGYLGCLAPGKELVAFSFWNHGFTLYGLTRMYEATGDESILELARRAAEFILTVYADPSAPDILDASNMGSQNISCLYAMGRMYALTHEERYLQFIARVLAHCETTDMPLLSFGSIFDLRSKKGIEMLVVYLGILQYGHLAEDARAIDAARRYWQEIWETQIRNTGNGTVREKWTEGGNAARLMPTEQKPNETCVAVGWTELSLALFHADKKPVYLDAVEKTIFNHMIGSLEKGGKDLAYYQGNYGKKIYRTDDGAYQCCRYRGFTLFSYLKEYLYCYEDGCLYPLLYGPSVYEDNGLTVTQETDYPKTGKITFTVCAQDAGKGLKLRIPAWCEAWQLQGADGKITEDGFLTVPLKKGTTQCTLDMTMPLKQEQHEIEGKTYLSYTYGPLLLAADTHYGCKLWREIDPAAGVIRTHEGSTSLVHFVCDGVHLVDFASAGGNDPAHDQYTVFIPQRRT
jgi:DUF1680 family protein